MNQDVSVLRHSYAHVLAQAIHNLYGTDVKLAIGPSIDTGFYYDFDFGEIVLSEDELKKIEKEMKHIIRQNQSFEKSSKPIDEAIALFKEQNSPYKLQLAEELKLAGEVEAGFYTNKTPQGKEVFMDMCIGPHVEATKNLSDDAFSLYKVAGAYWKGDAKNKMLTRIYGYAFANRAELDAHLLLLEEAKKRDHKILGKKLDLFSFQDAGPGFPFFHHAGMQMLNELQKYWREVHYRDGYQETRTPIMLNKTLWEQSGHWGFYRENMYTSVIDEQEYAIKPMNCPGGMLIYKNSPKSYRDLPLKAGEFGQVHRHELSGTLNGLFRVRTFTQDDAHIFCTEEQFKDEIKKVIDLIFEMYGTFGFDKINIELSTRPEGYIGELDVWNMAEDTLKMALEEKELPFVINEWDGAFYGPKIDFKIFDALGREWQCGTVQLDFALPKRFELEYTGKDGEKHTPIMLHRVVYGSLERFMGILIENFAGIFPLWIAPRQVTILPVGESFVPYAQEVYDLLKKAGFRVDIDDSNESLGKKIRNAEQMRINYALVVGEKEQSEKSVAVRDYKTKEQYSLSLEEFITTALEEISTRKL